MRSKKTEQLAQKQSSNAQRKDTKKRRAAPEFQVPAPNRQERQRFLIVCEGLNTEPDYFNQFLHYFRLSAVEIIAVGGAGETLRVVERAQKESEKSDFDQIWVVFDKDDFPSYNFDNAVNKAEAAGFRVAYSNQAFEYWLILHFENHQGGAMHRDQYGNKLNEYLTPFKISYNLTGGKRIHASFFHILMEKDSKYKESRCDLAIKRAEKVIAFHENESSPAAAESSTTVFKLVRELLRFV